MKSLLNHNIQIQYINDTKEYYCELLESFRESANEESDDESELSQSFQIFFKLAINNNKLDDFNTQNWYFFSIIQRIIQVLELHDCLEISDDLELSDSEDELFNLWHDSEFAKVFLLNLNESKDLLKESRSCLRLVEKQAEAFFHIHIEFNKDLGDKLNHQMIPEIGDSKNRLYSLCNGQFHTGEIDFNSLDSSKLNFKEQPNKVRDFTLHSSSKEIDSTIDHQLKRIDQAIEVISKSSPELLSTLKTFTKIIVPIDEVGIVSYSMQSLPFVSCINLYDRDFHDLIDDLMHENGHHYLNFILNTNDLIFEDDEKIYYSAWRKALRPVRGIYHAYFTFYWAFKTYLSLKESNTKFSQRDDSKILMRLLEEALMLDFSWHEVIRCYQDGKISELGLEVVNPIEKEVSSFMDTSYQKFKVELKNLSEESYHNLIELEKRLDQARLTYLVD